MLLAFSHVEQSMEFPRYAFLVTPYLGGLVKSICDAILGVSLGLVAVSYLAEQWLNRSKNSKMEMCPRIGDLKGTQWSFSSSFWDVLGFNDSFEFFCSMSLISLDVSLGGCKYSIVAERKQVMSLEHLGPVSNFDMF